MDLMLTKIEVFLHGGFVNISQGSMAPGAGAVM